MYVNDYYENKKGNKILFIIIIAVLFILGVIFLFIRIPSKNMKDDSKKQEEVRGKIEEKEDKKNTKDKCKQEDLKQEDETIKQNQEEKNSLEEKTTEEDNKIEETKTTEKKVVKKSTTKKNISKTPRRQSGVIASIKTYYN